MIGSSKDTYKRMFDDVSDVLRAATRRSPVSPDMLVKIRDLQYSLANFRANLIAHRDAVERIARNIQAIEALLR